jgi:hypothetical protein
MQVRTEAKGQPRREAGELVRDKVRGVEGHKHKGQLRLAHDFGRFGIGIAVSV